MSRKSRPPRPKIAVYAICLNEEQFVDRFVDTATDADLIVVADTGSTDATVAAFERRGIKPHTISIKPWRFDAARNAALALVPDDVDICVSLDLDEMLMPNWRRVLERAWLPRINHVLYAHAFNRDVTGLWQVHFDNRIHARHGFVWRYPCHECIVADGVVEHIAVIRHLRIEHHPDPDKSRSQYLPLLELAVREEPDEPRHAFYLGRELFSSERPAEAVGELERFLALSGGAASGQRCAALRLIARSHDALGDPDAALAAYRFAAADAPEVRGPQIDLAWALYQRERWAECYAAAKAAIAIPELVVEYGCDSEFGVIPEDMAAICGWRLGHQNEALIFGRRALAKAPGVDRIRLNVERMEQALGVAPGRAPRPAVAAKPR